MACLLKIMPLLSALLILSGCGQKRVAKQQPTPQEARWAYQERFFEGTASKPSTNSPQLWSDHYGSSQQVPSERAEELAKKRVLSADEAESGGYKKNSSAVNADDLSSPEWQGRDPKQGSATREW